MPWIPAFTVWQFALAGAIAAAGPVLIHLLNRRRYRVVQWAAMDFLREALQRNRRMLQLRDWLLMFLRSLALLLFGLALARPFFSSFTGTSDDRQPLHAILVLDNSLSMSYETLGGSLLQQAKLQAKRFLEKLPVGSRVSVIPACGSSAPFTLEPYANVETAQQAIERIAVVDRSLSVTQIVNEAKKAAETMPQLAKRTVVFTDQQLANWRGLESPEQLLDSPAMQFVHIAPEAEENTCVATLRLEDEIADVETPAKFVAEIKHVGATSRTDLPVSLWIDGNEVATKTVTLEAGSSTREVDFEYLFQTYTPEPGRPLFVPVKVSITPDHLAADDERHLITPVVSALPVVFIDQFGARENPTQNLLGETRSLRKLLAPHLSRQSQPTLIRAKHVTPNEVDRELLADARAVVVAGITEPSSELVQWLREYVEQGGELLIAAGADFDPKRWQEAAWLEGNGILPAPLLPEPLGDIPERVTGELKPFFLSFESLRNNPLFQIAGVAENDLLETYTDPFFFKLVQVDVSDEMQAALREHLQRHFTKVWSEKMALQAASQSSATKNSNTKSSSDISSSNTADGNTSSTTNADPLDWLLWAKAAEFAPEHLGDGSDAARVRWVEEQVQRTLPQVWGRFSNEQGPPFLVSRRVGHGQIVFCSTGLVSSWNNLPSMNAIVVFDRLVREMLSNTLPERNREPREQLTLPIARQESDMLVSLVRPQAVEPEPLDVGFIGQDQRGVVLPHLLNSGVYRVVAQREERMSGEASFTKLWEIPLAIQTDAQESEPQFITPAKFSEITAGAPWQWLEAGDEISLAGATIQGQNMWWYLVLAVLILLLTEMLTLAWPLLRAPTL